MPAIDTGIVTIYDTKNGGAPLQCHAIDAQEFLKHPSGRWSASQDSPKQSVKDAPPLEIKTDDGKAMQLKAQSFKALQAEAKKAGIDITGKKKAELVEALLKNDD